MKKTYIKPVSRTMVCEPFCSLYLASVHEGSLEKESFDHFDVVEQEKTKSDEVYSGLWGNSNKDKWGDD